VIACGVTALTLTTITIVVLFWENERLIALGVLSGLFVIATIVAGWGLNKSLSSGPGFGATLSELDKDRTCLQARD
jgi:uncharacterized membrane protein YqjE